MALAFSRREERDRARSQIATSASSSGDTTRSAPASRASTSAARERTTAAIGVRRDT